MDSAEDKAEDPRMLDRRDMLTGMTTASILAGAAVAASHHAMAADANPGMPRKPGKAMSTAQRLDLLESAAEISELRAKYAWWEARGDGEKIFDTFTEDGVFETPAGQGKRHTSRGRAEFVKGTASLKPGSVIPTYHNETIEIDGDQATGTVVMDSRVVPGFPNGFVGYYLDTLRRVNGHWKFTERKFYLYWPTFETP